MPINSNASTIIRALGGDLKTGMCHCPVHDDKRPSLKVTDGRHGNVLVKCFAGCTQEKVIDALRARELWNGRQHNPRAEPEKRNDDRDEERDELRRFHHAYKILYAALRAKEGAPVVYLRERGINLVPKCAMMLPADSSAIYTGKRYPAMVCPIIGSEGLQGTHLTWLSSDTKQKLALSDGKPRRIYGSLRGGYVICRGLRPDDDGLVIGEGIETTLAAMQISGLPGIAAVSTSNLPTIRPPQCAKVIIAADNDDPGRHAAAQLAERLKYEGRDVLIAKPPVEGTDWNDRLIEDEETARGMARGFGKR
jgi:putative DNA primase/helicase